MDISQLTQPKRTERFHDSYGWDVVQTDVYSVEHMDDEELKQAVVSDLLTAGYDKDSGAGEMPLTEEDVSRLVQDPQQKERVTQALNSPEVQRLLDTELLEAGQYAIKNTTATLQRAMDYCGVYVIDSDEYEYPEGLITGGPMMEAYKDVIGDPEEAREAMAEDIINALGDELDHSR